VFAELSTTAARTLPRLCVERARAFAPGVVLCLALAVGAMLLADLEAALFGRAWIDGPVIAILAGSMLRTFHQPAGTLVPGISFSGRTLLEVAIVLLGATLSVGAMMAVGPLLLAGIVFVVTVSIVASFGLARLLGLPRRTAALIATGNSICGNSAIMAVAPIIGATSQEIASSVAFTALVGVIVVVALPFLGEMAALTDPQFGILAGLTVYAVPQVLAATAPVGTLAIQVGTIVKLARVVMLGPVCVAFSLLRPKFQDAGAPVHGPPLKAALPWFVVGFLVMAALRSIGLVPEFAAPPLAETSKFLTVMALAALGLGVDLRAAMHAGPRIIATALGSVLLLGILAAALLAIL
jgi:uncharacterized integral membrane protein (TIGR00698 family)